MRSSLLALLLLSLCMLACQPLSSQEQSTNDSEIQPTFTSLPPTATPPPSATPSPIPTATPQIELPPIGIYLDHIPDLQKPLYAMTIDDGFGTQPYDAMAAELRNRGIHATYFLVAEAAINLGIERLEQLAEDGHSVSYHSYAHDDLAILEDWAKADWLADYELWVETMLALMGEDLYEEVVRPYARAPYGLFNISFLAMTKEVGLIPVGWSRDPGDLNVGLTVRPGDIFLLHVRYPDADILPQLLDEIQLTPVSLDELFAAQ